MAEFNILHPSRARDFFLEVLKRSHLYYVMKGIRDKLFGSKELPPLSLEMESKLVAGTLNDYRTNTDIVEAIGEKMQFTSVFYWQPTPYTRANRNRFEESWLTDNAQKEFFSDVYASVGNSPLQSKASFHDISGIFQGYDGTLYIDFVHTTERDNRIIANRIVHDVAPLIERESPDAKRHPIG